MPKRNCGLFPGWLWWRALAYMWCDDLNPSEAKNTLFLANRTLMLQVSMAGYGSCILREMVGQKKAREIFSF